MRDAKEEVALAEQMQAQLNDGQRDVFNTIMQVIEHEDDPQRYVYVSDAAGTAKILLSAL